MVSFMSRPGRGPVKSRSTLVFILLLGSALLAGSVSAARGANSYVLNPANQVQSAMDCAAIGGAWDGASSCLVTSGGGVAQGDFVNIDPGAFLKIYHSTFSANGFIEINGGTLFVDSTGSMVVSTSGRIDNIFYNNACAQFGVNNYGRINNSGTIGTTCNFYDQSGARLINFGGAYIFAAGGTFKNEGGATLVNLKGGAFQDLNGPTSVNPGLVYNYGAINNSGFLQLYSGTTINYTKSGYFQGTFNSVGTLNMISGSTLTVGYGGFASIPTILDVAPGATFTIPKGVTVYVSSSAGLRIESAASMLNYGELSSQSGQATYKSGMVNDSGNITNYFGSIVNDNGTFNIASGASVDNGGDATFEMAQYNGIVYNDGTFQNFKDGWLLVNENAIINNNAQLFNYGNFTISKNAALNNNQPGFLYNNGAFDNQGNVTSFAAIDDHAGGVVHNGGDMQIPGTVNVFQNSSFANDPTGLLGVNKGGSLNVYPGGLVSNGGLITSSGSILVAPQANLINAKGGTLATDGAMDNYGTVANSVGATLVNNAGGRVDLWGRSLTTNAGGISNNATIYQHCYAVYKDSGTYAGKPVTVQDCGSAHPTVAAVVPNPSNAALGGTLTFKVTVRDTATGTATTPTGWVSWTDGKSGGSFSASGVCQLAGGVCSINYTAPPVNEVLSINASYSGDQVHIGSSGSSQLTVGSASGSTTTTLSLPASSTTSAGSTTLTSSTGSGGGVPEFPYQLLAAVILTVMLVVSYALIRSRSAVADGS